MSKLTTEYGLLNSAINGKLSTEYANSTVVPPVIPWVNEYYYQGPGTAATTDVANTGVYGNTSISAWNTNVGSPINTFRDSNNVSFSFWAYLPNTINSSTYDFSIFSEIVGYKSVDIIFRCVSGLEYLQVWECNGGTVRNYLQISTGFTLGAWNHIIITFGGSPSSTMGVAGASLYVNNSSARAWSGSTVATCTASGSTLSKTCIGGGKAYNNTYTNMSVGEPNFSIDELCLFNGTLTSEDRATLYNGGQTFDITTASLSTGVTLQRYFRFGDGTDSESTLKDYSGLGDGFELTKNSIITATKLVAY